MKAEKKKRKKARKIDRWKRKRKRMKDGKMERESRVNFPEPEEDCPPPSRTPPSLPEPLSSCGPDRDAGAVDSQGHCDGPKMETAPAPAPLPRAGQR